jgi:acetylornithine deacetylase/succinyl-diaminopimelate desuccinylase-like protein
MSFPTADDPRRIALLEAIEAREDELVDLARALVRIPTINPPGRITAPAPS